MEQHQPRLIDDFRRRPVHKSTTRPHILAPVQAYKKPSHKASRQQLVTNYERLKHARGELNGGKEIKDVETKSRSIALSSYVAYDFLLLTILGYIATYTGFINWVVLLYLIFVIIRRIKSQQIFALALASLILIPFLTLFRRSNLASSYAIIAFFMLCIGLIQAIIELKTQPQGQ